MRLQIDMGPRLTGLPQGASGNRPGRREGVAMLPGATPPVRVHRRVQISARLRSTNRLTDGADRRTFNTMVESGTPQLDTVFRALGDATRRRMLLELAQGERTVGQLAEPFAMSLAAASKHIKALENAGLVRREVRWRTHICRLEPGPLASAHHWLSTYERFWTDHLDVLERLLREQDGNRPPPPPMKQGDDQ
jgi:DNA-binding transcriptional ArsR family regulator